MNNGFGVGLCRENDIDHAEAPPTDRAAPMRGIGTPARWLLQFQRPIPFG
jgi:hypothetical protein